MNKSGPVKRALITTIALAALLGSSGCDYLYLEHTNCRYYDGPQFDRLSLKRPVLNQVYSDKLRILIDEDRHIDSYNYHLEFSGELPRGITLYENNRTIIFEGTATSLGVYSFALIVDARYRIFDRYDFYGYHDYCRYRTVQNYQLVVEPF